MKHIGASHINIIKTDDLSVKTLLDVPQCENRPVTI